MKTFELIEQDNAIGHNNPRNTKYFVDGKRVTKAELIYFLMDHYGWPVADQNVINAAIYAATKV